MAVTDIVDHRPWPLPERPWVMHQSWYEFLFLHWKVDPVAVRRLVPESLELDLHDGDCWVGLIPFKMENVRPRGTFNLPGVSSFLELNVRTYVRHGGKAGVYFLSLEANQKAAVEVARAWYDLPYMHATMSSTRWGARTMYRSKRWDKRGRAANYRGSHRVFGDEHTADPGSLEHWLCERYALFTVESGSVWMGDVHHVPWPLKQAEVTLEEQSLLASHGLEVDSLHPDHVMYSPGVDTVVWAPVRLDLVAVSS